MIKNTETRSSGTSRRPVLWGLVVLLGFAVGVMSQLIGQPKSPENEPAKAEMVTPRPMPRYIGRSGEGHYLASRVARSQKDLAQAAHYIELVRQQDRTDDEVARAALQLLALVGDVEEAFVSAQPLLKKEPDNGLARLIALSTYAKYGRFEEALTLLEQPEGRGLYQLMRPLLAQWMSLGINPKQAPMKGIKGIELVEALQPLLQYQLALMNDMAGHKELAAKQYDQSIILRESLPYRLMQAVVNFQLRHGKPGYARKVYQRYVVDNEDSELIPSPEELGLSMTPVPEALLVEDSAQGMAEVLFAMGGLLLSDGLKIEAALYLQLAVYLQPDFPAAQLMLGNAFEAAGDYHSAVRAYESIKTSSVFQRRARYRVALTRFREHDDAQAKQLLKALLDEHADYVQGWMLLGDIHRSAKDYLLAIDAYGEAIRRTEQAGEAVEWDVLYARGTSYERADQWELAEADLLRALELEPDQPDVLNYLGYSWLVQGKHRDKATLYIKEALEQRPQASHIIDSMGWALYLQGAFEPAVGYLEQAVELTPHDPTLNDHLGDAYWRVGRRVEATFQWKRALGLEPDDAATIEAKLEKGLPEWKPLPQQAVAAENPVAATAVAADEL